MAPRQRAEDRRQEGLEQALGVGLSSLTQSALKGIRNMPAHGGNAGLSDLELARGVAYMVNQSGGKWTEPASAGELKAERTGAQVVKMQCVKCHQDGKGGAPKIGIATPGASASRRASTTQCTRLSRATAACRRAATAPTSPTAMRAAILYMYNAKAAAKAEAKK